MIWLSIWFLVDAVPLVFVEIWTGGFGQEVSSARSTIADGPWHDGFSVGDDSRLFDQEARHGHAFRVPGARLGLVRRLDALPRGNGSPIRGTLLSRSFQQQSRSASAVAAPPPFLRAVRDEGEEH